MSIALLIMLVGAVGFGVFLTRLVTRSIAAKADAAALPDEVYAELDDLRAQVMELEGRQDFSERLLTDQAEPAVLPDEEAR